MKIKQVMILSLMPLLLNPSVSTSAEADVTWANPSEYSDIDAGNNSRKSFQAKVFGSLGKHFGTLSKKLPEGQTLKVEVTDLDLAGQVRYGVMNEIRVIKDIYIPRISFTYQLLSVDKSVISEDSVKLKNIGFMHGSAGRNMHHDEFKHEKRMLDKWFNKTFIKQDKK
jgi:hypothetical protein